MRLILIFTFLCWCSTAWAEDMRMTVDIQKQQQPNMAMAAKKALPILLDRLLPQQTTVQHTDMTDPASLVLRLSNHQKYTQVIFHDMSVAKTFKQLGVAWFEQPPRLNLRIEMLNTAGKPMVKSRLFMENEAKHMARHWGIQLSDSGATLLMRWQWQQDGMVSLVVESRLGSFREQRAINLKKPVPQMKAWLQQVMLKHRDAQLRKKDVSTPQALGEVVHDDGRQLLEVKRAMRLEEAVAFEAALRLEKGVKALIPYGYSKQQQSYIIEVNTEDDGWLQRWFQLRGMQLNRTEQGWAVR